MTTEKASFSFGKNWEIFINEYFTEERVAISKKHILDFLQLSSLEGKYFLDVGCGSGLSSLAAFEAGADRIVSFDVDAYSVKTTQHVRELRGNPDHWVVLQGSVLDKAFMATIEPADVLYSWGVLHHTGAMWTAIENTMPLMKPDGVFYVALYTTTPRSPFWIRVKKVYNRAPGFGKFLLEMSYLGYYVASQIKHGKNPFASIKSYKRSRGMAFMVDVRDWLGGWPYEDASVEQVTAFFEQRNFELANIKTGEANTEYFFAKK